MDTHTEPGPRPIVRAVVGLLAGLAAGVVAALLVPRERPLEPRRLRAVPDEPGPQR